MMVDSLLIPMSVTPVQFPADGGVKRRSYEQLAPGSSELPQVMLSKSKENPWPVTLIVPREAAVVPVLVMVTVFEVVVVTACVPKLGPPSRRTLTADVAAEACGAQISSSAATRRISRFVHHIPCPPSSSSRSPNRCPTLLRRKPRRGRFQGFRHSPRRSFSGG